MNVDRTKGYVCKKYYGYVKCCSHHFEIDSPCHESKVQS